MEAEEAALKEATESHDSSFVSEVKKWETVKAAIEAKLQPAGTEPALPTPPSTPAAPRLPQLDVPELQDLHLVHAEIGASLATHLPPQWAAICQSALQYAMAAHSNQIGAGGPPAAAPSAPAASDTATGTPVGNGSAAAMSDAAKRGPTSTDAPDPDLVAPNAKKPAR